MDNPVCARCGKPQAEHFIPFAAVATDTDKTYSTEGRGANKVETTTKTVTERLVDIESINVCEDCIKKQRKSSGRTWGLGFFLLGLAAGFGITFLLTVGSFTGKNARPGGAGISALISLGVGAVLGILFGIGMGKYQSGLETPFIAAKVYAKLPGVCNTYNYVPLVPELYHMAGKSVPDAAVFKNKNNLKTDLADTIFREYLRSPQDDGKKE